MKPNHTSDHCRLEHECEILGTVRLWSVLHTETPDRSLPVPPWDME